MEARLHELSPEAIERVDRARGRAAQRAARRELACELVVAGTFAVVATGLAFHTAGPRHVVLAAALTLVYTLLLHIEFEVGEGHTHPTQLVLVPMLVLLPAYEVPVAVAAAHVLAGLTKSIRGRAAPQRIVVAIADASYSLAPALMFVWHGPVHGVLGTAGLVVVATAALVASDLGIAAFRLRVGLGLGPREELRGFVWLYVADACLMPVGLLAALAGRDHPWLVALVLPLAGLLAIFAQERRGRIENALELQRLAEEEHDRLEAIVQNSSDLIAIVDEEGVLRTISGLVEPIFGDERDAGRGERLPDRVHPHDAAAVAAFLRAVADKATGEAQETEWRMRYADGTYRHLEAVATNLVADPKVRGIVITARDIEARKAFEEQLRHRAFHDALTGLANRALFYDRIEHALLRDRTDTARVAVMFIDLDEFKALNDTEGHRAGDDVLQEVGDRLTSRLRAGDTAARLGGDEFGILLEAITSPESVLETATRVLETLQRPYRQGKSTFRLSCSIGVAISKPGDRGVEELLRKADLAMYKAKRSGRARVELYKPGLEHGQMGSGRAAWFARADEQRAEVEAILRDPDAIHMVVQPMIDLRTGHVAGYEALMRVQGEPARGPDVWLMHAHRCGLGYALEARAITSALGIADRPSGVHLAINLSPSSLTSEVVLRTLPEDLTGLLIEVTENELVSDDPSLHEALAQLRGRGARVAVDDTGAGYAGLTHVMRIRPDMIKLDRALTTEVDRDPVKAALVASFVRYARDIDATVCAEGIETLAELECLAGLDVAFGQGYAIARPAAPWPAPEPAAQLSCVRSFEVALAGGSDRSSGHDPQGIEHLAQRIAEVTTGPELDGCLRSVARLLQCDEVRVAPSDLSLSPVAKIVVDAPGATPEEVSVLRASGFHSVLSLPLLHQGAPVGRLEAYRRPDLPWGRYEVSRARMVSYLLAAAVHRVGASPVLDAA